MEHVKKNLQPLESLYSDFVSAAELRYKTGETGLLEKTTAETKKGQLALLLQQTEREINTAYIALQTLMNRGEQFAIKDEMDYQPITLSLSLDTSLVINNPALKLYYQQAIIAEQNKKVEAASTLPDFSIGYFNQSLIGTQTVNGTDIPFGAKDRFDGFNVAIFIPLTLFSNNSKIKSMDYKYQALQKEAESEKLHLQTQLQNAFQQYNQYMSQYNYFVQFALPNAETIISTATLGFNSGYIGYIEYLSALQTATDTQLDYLQSVNQLNQAVININFLISQ
jgi:cobalt-zinc-cadmium resistance protein CzcA